MLEVGNSFTQHWSGNQKAVLNTTIDCVPSVFKQRVRVVLINTFSFVSPVVGVYKHWTGLLEWWNSGMVDWIFLFGFLIIYDVCSL